MQMMKEELEAKAATWIENGKQKEYLLDEWLLFIVKCWIYSSGLKQDDYSSGVTSQVSGIRTAIRNAIAAAK
jgi:hypothetical protein